MHLATKHQFEREIKCQTNDAKLLNSESIAEYVWEFEPCIETTHNFASLTEHFHRVLDCSLSKVKTSPNSQHSIDSIRD